VRSRKNGNELSGETEEVTEMTATFTEAGVEGLECESPINVNHPDEADDFPVFSEDENEKVL
jgi:hypothetical protein